MKYEKYERKLKAKTLITQQQKTRISFPVRNDYPKDIKNWMKTHTDRKMERNRRNIQQQEKQNERERETEKKRKKYINLSSYCCVLILAIVCLRALTLVCLFLSFLVCISPPHFRDIAIVSLYVYKKHAHSKHTQNYLYRESSYNILYN